MQGKCYTSIQLVVCMFIEGAALIEPFFNYVWCIHNGICGCVCVCALSGHYGMLYLELRQDVEFSVCAVISFLGNCWFYIENS